MKIFHLAFLCVILAACSSSGDGQGAKESAANQKPVLTTAYFPTSDYRHSSKVSVIAEGAGDPDGDKVTLRYQWVVDGDIDETLTGDEAPAGSFTRGSTVLCRVIPNDGKVDGDPVETNTIYITNTPPETPAIAVYPKAGTAPNGLWAVIETGAKDDDGDRISYTYTWSKNYAVLTTYPSSQTTIARAELNHGDLWKVTVTARDGGSSVSTSTLRRSWLWNVSQLSLGENHACALLSDGGVKCWGRNNEAQIGLGFASSVNNVISPLTAGGYSSGVSAVAAGGYHTCVLINGGVKCWGSNSDGQIGNNSSGLTPVVSPTSVVNATTGIKAIVAGTYHTCALTTGGGVKCWGDNNLGSVGNSTSGNNVLTAQNVTGLTSGVKAITAGFSHTCALTTAGGVKCWGGNYFGQLGNGKTDNETNQPGNVLGLTTGVAAIAAGDVHTCALLTTGAVKCWGDNFYGQAGNNSSTLEITSPTDVSTLSSGATSIAAGSDHVCVALTDGSVKCWGRNGDGETGIGEASYKVTTPPATSFLTGVAQVFAGTRFSCALTVAGGVKCWGDNLYNQMGINTTRTDDVLIPLYVFSLDMD